jgi:penicillin-binding protein 2
LLKHQITRLVLLALAGCLILSSCTPSSFAVEGLGATAPSGTSASTAADAQTAAVNFIEAWKKEDYASMYNLITQVSRDAVTLEDFEKKYTDAAQNLGFNQLDGSILSVLPGDQVTQIGIRVTFKTSVFGALTRDIVMNLTREENLWRVQWEDGLILPELHGGNRLTSDYDTAGRGDIYDHNGAPIATQMDAVAIGLKPVDMIKPQEGNLLLALTKLTGRTEDSLRKQIEDNRDSEYIPISEVTSQAVQQMSEELSLLRGLVMTPYKGRFYFNEGIAPQTVGYLLKISPDQLDTYRRKGYSGEETVGASGLEAWAEDRVAGIRGGSVYVVDPRGNIITRLANARSKAPEYMYTTLDKDLQIQAQRAMEGYKGAIVVIERDSGKILAMVSAPGYDANLFETNNFNSGYLLNKALNDPQKSLLNRVTQGAYPMGSIFKIITMTAALESGDFRSNTIYDCGYRFTELPGTTLYDWTYTYQKSPSGKIDLITGLVRSCNPYFWHIGLDMFKKGDANDIVDHASIYGLGKPTGMQELEEVSGQVLDPKSEGDAVQLAIGQGSMLATPLQVAVMISAIGNGGNMYRPEIVSKFTSPDGNVTFTSSPEVVGKLNERPQIMDVIRTAMRRVVTDEKGTAQAALAGIQIPIYGKTGTASTAEEEPHSWFAGYTDAFKETKKPDITIVVLAENAGEGSMVAAPIFRRIIEIYYSGRPSKLLPWESSLYVTRKDEPTATPTGEPGATIPAESTAAPVDQPAATKELPTVSPILATATP